MAKVNPNKEKIIGDILSELDFGIDRADCLDLIGKKWQTSTRTFDRYWQEALSRFSALNLRTQKAFDELRLEGKKEALKKAILTKHERMEILTQIAKGEIPLVKHIVCDGVIQEVDVVPAWADRKAAIAELNKMDGEYAPIKKDITSGGEPLKQITGIVVE